MWKILVLFPEITSEADSASIKQFLEKWKSTSFEVDVGVPKDAPHSIGPYLFDKTEDVPFITEAVKEAERKGYAAVIINCAGDPGVQAARKAVRIPVIGAGEPSYYLASMMSNKFSVIEPGVSTGGEQHHGSLLSREHKLRFRELGLGDKLASIRTLPISHEDFEKDRESVVELIVAEGGKAINEDGADVLVFGCSSFSELATERDFLKRLKVPVVSPLLAALKTAEALVLLGYEKVADVTGV